MSLGRWLAAAGGAVWLLSSACAQVGLGGEPLVYPNRARLGETVAVAFDSNFVPPASLQTERYNLSLQNVAIRLRQSGTTLVDIQPGANDTGVRAVFDGLSAPASVRNLTAPGSFATIVLFDLPASLSATLPASNVKVHLLVNGVQVGTPGTMTITASGGSKTNFYLDSHPSGMMPQPTLRVQANLVDQGDDGFDAEWGPIGGIEFKLEFPTSKLSSPQVYGMTEGAQSLAFLGPVTSGSVKVVLTDPRGITLAESPSNTPGTVGEGPLLELAWAKTPGQSFAVSDFTVRDLKVTDLDGNLLTPSYSAGTDNTAYFKLTTRRDGAE